MFIGHFAVRICGQEICTCALRPRLLLAAPQVADALWPFFLLLGWEQVRIDPGNTRFTPLDFVSYPWSHSLLMLCVWATVFAGNLLRHHALPAGCRRDLDRRGEPLGAGLGDASAGHAASARRGAVRIRAVELDRRHNGGGDFDVRGRRVWMYARATRARDRIGRWAFVAYVVLLLVIYIADAFSPPPDNVAQLAWTAVAAVAILIPWAWWFDRHRSAA